MSLIWDEKRSSEWGLTAKGKQSHLSLHSDSAPVFHHILKPVGASLALAVGVYRSTACVFGHLAADSWRGGDEPRCWEYSWL